MSNQYYSPQQPSYGYAVVPVSPDIVRGQQHAQTSMILGIISLVVGPIALILGPLAIVYAGKAEALRVPQPLAKSQDGLELSWPSRG